MRGIYVIGVSADGDSRLLSAMRLLSKLQSVKADIDFNVSQLQEYFAFCLEQLVLITAI